MSGSISITTQVSATCPPLASCPNLTELSVVDTAVSDLSPLAGHPSLKELTLSSTKVTDVSPLATIPTLEMIWLYGTAVEDVSCLASLPRLNDLNLRKTQVVDLSAFQGREHILGIERKKLGIKKVGKSAEEIKTAIEEVRARLEKLGITPRPPLKRTEITAFQEKTGVKLPKEYTAFLTKIGDGFQVKLGSFLYKFPPLSEVLYDPEGIKKRFSHRESWCWEDDDSATGRKIAAYYGCMLLRPGKVLQFDDVENPQIMEDFLRALGAEPVVFPQRNECCGGYVALEDAASAKKKSNAVSASAASHGAELMVTACPLCKYNLVKNGSEVPAIYFTELLAEALGVKEEEDAE